jgi:diguanylate cyclase (GGDEF)-like protein
VSTNPLSHSGGPQLAATQVDDLIRTPLEARFNRLVRLTRRALGTRVAAISFLDHDGEWFKAVTGWNVGQLPAERSLAALLGSSDGPVAISDMLEDPRTRNHPLVEGSPRFRFCAIQPILDRGGSIMGVLAAYDVVPHKITADLLEALSDAGELARRELRVSELGSIQQKMLASLDTGGREALLDDLTRLWNRRGAMLLLEQALEGGQADVSIGVCVLDVDGFKQVNDEFGQALGNVMLRKLGAAIVDSVRPGDIVGRLGGDEFLLLIPNVDPDHLGHIMDRVKGRVQSLAVRTRVGSVKVTVSIGGTLGSGGDRPEDLLRQADEAMRDGKRRRRNEGAGVPTGDDDGHQGDASPNPDH